MNMQRLVSLRADYEAVTGLPFQYFFCPITWKDEDVPLCRAHVINKAFHGADRSWTVQRTDVDNWFGSLFENDFLATELQHQRVIEQALTHKDLFRRFRPKLSVDDSDVDYYVSHGSVPPHHTTVDLEANGENIQIGLKLSPSEALSRLDGTWAFESSRDIRLPALVSVLKAAYLTMFHLQGYRFALSDGGRFVGKTVLGDLYLKTQGVERSEALSLAHEHCKPFANMVRPVIGVPSPFRGTVTDRLVYFLMSGPRPWAFSVFVRTGRETHAAVLPIMDDADSAARFHRFLQVPSTELEVRMGRLGLEQIEISDKWQTIEWPEALFDKSIL